MSFLSHYYSNTAERVFCFDRSTIRVWIRSDGKAWFASEDIARILRYSNIEKELAGYRHLQPPYCLSDTMTHAGETISVVNDFGLHVLIATSNYRKASAFKRWVNKTLLPATYDMMVDQGYASGRQLIQSVRELTFSMECSQQRIHDLEDKIKRHSLYSGISVVITIALLGIGMLLH